MRKYLGLALILIGISLHGQTWSGAGLTIYSGPLVDSKGLAYSSNYVLDLYPNNIDLLSWQATYSSASFKPVNVYDGILSTQTITVISTRCVNTIITIANVNLYEGRNWTASYFSTDTAKSIATGINANNYLKPLIKAEWRAGTSIVFATSTVVGAVGIYNCFASSPSAISIVRSSLNVIESGFNYTNSVMTAANHGFTLGLPVLLSTVTGNAPNGLTSQTTYYAIPITVNTFGLSSTSTGAIAGSYITISSYTYPGNSKLTFFPIPFSGTAELKWQGSNDSKFWQDLSVSSLTYQVTGASTTLWDFQIETYRYVQLVYKAPTWGGLNLVVTGNGKSITPNPLAVYYTTGCVQTITAGNNVSVSRTGNNVTISASTAPTVSDPAIAIATTSLAAVDTKIIAGILASTPTIAIMASTAGAMGDANAIAIASCVTINTNQTITGQKTFTGAVFGTSISLTNGATIQGLLTAGQLAGDGRYLTNLSTAPGGTSSGGSGYTTYYMTLGGFQNDIYASQSVPYDTDIMPDSATLTGIMAFACYNSASSIWFELKSSTGSSGTPTYTSVQKIELTSSTVSTGWTTISSDINNSSTFLTAFVNSCPTTGTLPVGAGIKVRYWRKQ